MIEFDLTLTRPGGFTLSAAGQAADAEFLTLFGPSGSGKTTLLRLIAGLEPGASGQLLVDGQLWFDSAKGIHLPPQQRSVGFVFQDYALFPAMSVRDNIAYAAGRGQDGWVDELLALTELSALAARKPEQLSGGQQQRVALARALARRPRLLLLDEPLSALHPALRHTLQSELLALHRRFGLTTLLVSHDIAEVFHLADRVLVCEHGRIVQQGTPQQVFVGEGSRQNRLSLSAQVLSKRRSDVVWVLTLLIGQEIVEVLADDDEAAATQPGMRVQVLPQAFSPLLQPLAQDVSPTGQG